MQHRCARQLVAQGQETFETVFAWHRHTAQFLCYFAECHGIYFEMNAAGQPCFHLVGTMAYPEIQRGHPGRGMSKFLARDQRSA